MRKGSSIRTYWVAFWGLKFCGLIRVQLWFIRVVLWFIRVVLWFIRVVGTQKVIEVCACVCV